jgi:hypothetical protein
MAQGLETQGPKPKTENRCLPAIFIFLLFVFSGMQNECTVSSVECPGRQNDKTLNARPRTILGHRAGQVSGEFMVILSAMLLLFYVFYMLYIGQLTNSWQANEKLVAMRIASGIRSAINHVYLSGEGTVYNTTVRTHGYNVSIHNGVVGVESDFAAYYLPTLTRDINATTVNQGEVVISNRGGVINIA